MKTTQQIKSEVVNYLKKSSNHLFQIGNDEHKIILHDNFYIRITGKNIYIENIDKVINYYESNSKNVIKNNLFLIPRYYNLDIKTIPYYKLAREKYKNIIDSIEGKTDIHEIKYIITNILK